MQEGIGLPYKRLYICRKVLAFHINIRSCYTLATLYNVYCMVKEVTGTEKMGRTGYLEKFTYRGEMKDKRSVNPLYL